MSQIILKVVGASWLKTKISTYILVGASLLAIGCLFMAEIERPKLNGIYCATAYWSKKSGFKIEYWKQRNDFNNIPKGVARTCYQDSTNINGWSQIEIETQKIYPDWVQAFAAGLLEGSMAWRNIYYQWTNTIAATCDHNERSQNFCIWLRDTFTRNYDKIKKISDRHKKYDSYWHQIRLFFYQLEGLEAGWRKGVKRSRSNLDIPSNDFILMNNIHDIDILHNYYEKLLQKNDNHIITNITETIPNGKMIINLNKNKFLFGHSSYGKYSTMLRVHKRYKLQYHMKFETKTNLINSIDIIFTGYHGILASTDEFYIIKGKLVHSLLAGIDMKFDIEKLFKNVDFINLIPNSAHIMAVNRLAKSQQQWSDLMHRSSFFFKKQWIRVDLKKLTTLFNNNKTLEINNQKNLIFLYEQFTEESKIKDLTKKFLINETTCIFNGRTQLLSNKTLNNLLSKNPTDINDIEIILKNFSFRGDLNHQPIPYGNIDAKLFSYDFKKDKSEFYAIAGPLFFSKYKNDNDNKKTISSSESLVMEIVSNRRSGRDDIRVLEERNIRTTGPFKWSQKFTFLTTINHNGHPNEWNFDKVKPFWAWYDKKSVT